MSDSNFATYLYVVKCHFSNISLLLIKLKYDSSIIIIILLHALHQFTVVFQSFIFAHYTSTSTELMSGANTKWLHQKLTNY